MRKTYIYDEVERLVRKCKSRNPFDILSALNVVVMESNAYQKLKGYCFSANRTIYVVINDSYEANLFAADLLITDDVISDMSKDADMDYFRMCQTLSISPDLMSFKLFSLIKRGYAYPMPPIDMDCTFLGKEK